MQPLFRTCDRGINPLISRCLGVQRQVTGDIDGHVIPFTPLCLMASDGITEDATQRVQKSIFVKSVFESLVILLDPSLFHPPVKINIKGFLLFLGKVGRVSIKDIFDEQLGELPSRGQFPDFDIQKGKLRALVTDFFNLFHHHHVSVHVSADMIVLGNQKNIALL